MPGEGSEQPRAEACGILAQALAPLPSAQWRGHTEAVVLRAVSELTGVPTGALDALMEAGVDSLAATELSSRLRSQTGVALSPTLMFEHPTARAVAVHLLEQLGGAAACTLVAARSDSGVSSASPLALLGLSGCWPGGCGADTARTWWLQLGCGDAVGRVPALRWTLDGLVDVASLGVAQASCVRHGGFVCGAERFDGRAFGVSPAEVVSIQRPLGEQREQARRGTVSPQRSRSRPAGARVSCVSSSRSSSMSTDTAHGGARTHGLSTRRRA